MQIRTKVTSKLFAEEGAISHGSEVEVEVNSRGGYVDVGVSRRGQSSIAKAWNGYASRSVQIPLSN